MSGGGEGGGGGGEQAPPRNGGEFLLRLVQRQPQQIPSSVQPHGGGGVSLDPAVAAVGPPIALPPVNGHHYASPPDLLFHNHNLNLNHNRNHPCWPQQQQQHQQQQPSSFNPLVQFHPQRSSLVQGKMPFHSVHQDGPFTNLDFDLQLSNALHSTLSSTSYNHSPSPSPSHTHNHNNNANKGVYTPPGPPPGFGTTATGQPPRSRTGFEVPAAPAFYKDPHPKSMLHSASPSANDHSFSSAHAPLADLLDHGVGRARRDTNSNMPPPTWDSKAPEDYIGELSHQFGESSLVDEHHDNSDNKKKLRDKDFRSDPRGKHILPQKMRSLKRNIQCRSDIHRFDSRLLNIYESLIPASEEKAKQKQLLSVLEKLVCNEWPNARIYLYGSCANSFGVSKSDIDVCLAIADKNINKSEVLLKLADILMSDNLENVQALTRARVPIVKLKDPVTGISCDICINNVLAVVNTKLLHDYAEIDPRLRQLAFIVKHWAKSRAVNETYQGTLSSYAYVLMCIHFLQQRRPAILPCLQEMDGTYTVTVDDVKCSYFDQVERLQNFGARNKENIAQLVWAFFNYWAYCHDYANSVISVRTGSYLSKYEKDWTRRVGNERHLICIEDPFETAHDLGRVVDKHSIRVLREEFERAAFILQFEPNPCAELFRPYVAS